ncbi:MAG TPA: ABC transporter permease [Gemmatimonadaceae bacterium]|nr:ABC transporter permease [Gemmatimonadaceae bacterium]
MVNVKLAARTLFRTPFVTAVAVLSLALGIGANAAIFSLFDQVLLRPLPVSHPEQLVNLSAPGPKPGSQSCGQAGDCDEVFSYAMFRDLEKAHTAFSGIAAHMLFATNIAYHRQTINGDGVLVSGSYFPVLGLKPAIGRLFTPDDDRTIGANYLVVLSYDYWANQLGADPSVLGQPIVINGQSMTIIGVAPQGFEGTTLGARPMVFVPITMRAVMQPSFKGFENRQTYWAYLFARLAPGATMERASAAVNAVYQPIIRDVEAPLQKGMSDKTLAQFKAKTVTLADGQRGQSSVHRDAKTPLLMLFATTGIVLLIACANIANLLLARAANRATEMAVRLALGASRWRLMAQLLTESCVLAILGGIVSLVIAYWTLGLIVSFLPTDANLSLHFSLNAQAVLFTTALAIGTGLLFGLFPALHSTRPDLASAIRAGSGKTSGARSATRFRTSLVTAQIALSMALLISAGLFLKSLVNVSRVDLGIKIDHVVTFGISPQLNGYTNPRSATFFARAEEELAAIPGVTGVTLARVPLIAGSNWGNSVSVEGFKKGPDTDDGSRFNEVGAGYFHVMGVPLLSGRDFTLADNAGSPKVAIVNEAFAKKFNLGRDAVGKRMSMNGRSGDNTLDIEIVGLAKDAKYSQVKDQVPPVFFIPYRQDSAVGAMNFYVRTAGNTAQLERAIPGVIKQLDPNLPVEGLKTLPQQVKENVFLDRMISTLAAAFAVLATLLAAVGLYGVLAYSVTQRTKEIGVRMALGADGGRVQKMVLRQVGLMTLIGGALGIGGALALGRAARSLLFELQGYDPLVVAGAAVALALVAFGAGYIPALRASKVDPMQALRYE